MHNSKKIILCGGGTGGHIFPMLAIAEEFRKLDKNNKVLFVGSSDRMEMDIVPKYNFPIYGLWISGVKRSPFILNIIFLGLPFLLKNLSLPLKIFFSVIKSIYILATFRPDFVIGFGGYSSGPFLLVSSFFNFKTAIQEQNSYPGLTNKILSKKVKYIFTAYDNIAKFFTHNKVFNYGNPIRDLNKGSDQDPHKYFGLDKSKKTILVLGGSLGAKSINEGILNNISINERLINKAIERFCRPKLHPNLIKNLLKTRTNKKIKKIGCTDSSDGLFQALQDLAIASKCKAIINYEKIPKYKNWPKGDKWDEYYFFGGEDYELVFSLPKKWAQKLSMLDTNINEIGYFEDGEPSIEFKDNNKNKILNNIPFKHF